MAIESALIPRPELRPFVQAYYQIDDIASAAKSFVGGPGLSVDLWWVDGPPLKTAQLGGRSQSCKGALIMGALTKELSVSGFQKVRGFGVSLAPAVAPAVFGISAGELKDGISDLNDVLRQHAPELSRRIYGQNNIRGKIDVFESELLRLLAARPQLDHRVLHVLKRLSSSLENVSVEALAHEISYTRRRLLDLVKYSLGISPNHLVQILRFRKALDTMARWSKPDWLSLVCDCGYFDQSHFIRHCQQFTGLSPSQFLARGLFPPLRQANS